MKKQIKEIVFLTGAIFATTIASAQVPITSLDDMIKLRQIQQEANPNYSGAKAFSDGVQRGMEEAQIKAQMEEQFRKQEEVERYKRENIQQEQELEKLRAERESQKSTNEVVEQELNKLKAERRAQEREQQFLERLEKEKNACRILYKDFDESFVLGIEVMQADKTYQDIFSAKSQDASFNTAEFVYKLGKLHPNYKPIKSEVETK